MCPEDAFGYRALALSSFPSVPDQERRFFARIRSPTPHLAIAFRKEWREAGDVLRSALNLLGANTRHPTTCCQSSDMRGSRDYTLHSFLWPERPKKPKGTWLMLHNLWLLLHMTWLLLHTFWLLLHVRRARFLAFAPHPMISFATDRRFARSGPHVAKPRGRLRCLRQRSAGLREARAWGYARNRLICANTRHPTPAPKRVFSRRCGLRKKKAGE